MWRCINRLEFGTKYCKESPTIDEYKLHAAILQAINQAVTQKDEIFLTIQAGIRKAMNGDDRGIDELALKNRFNELDKMFNSLLKLTASSADSTEYFDEKFKVITDEQDAIKCQQRNRSAVIWR